MAAPNPRLPGMPGAEPGPGEGGQGGPGVTQPRLFAPPDGPGQGTPVAEQATLPGVGPGTASPTPPAAGLKPDPAAPPSAGTPDPGGVAGPGTTAPPAGARRGRFRIQREVRLTIMVIVLIFVIEYFLLPEVATARKNVGLLERVSPLWLVLATGLEVVSLLAYAQLTYTVLSPGAPRRFRLFRINMWSLAVSHVVPGGTVGGTAAGYRMLTDAGVPGSTAGFGITLQGVGSAVVLNLLFWLALVVSIPANGFNPLYGTAAVVGTVLLAAFGGSVFLLTRGNRAAVDRMARLAAHLPLIDAERVSNLLQHVADRLELLLRDRRLLTHALFWAAANWLLDASSLWVFLIAFGHTVFPIDLLVAYGLANILAAIPITPGGLGVVETVCVGALTGFGVPLHIAGLGVLTWRLVNFWLPIPGGGLAYLSLRLGPEARRRAAEREAARRRAVPKALGPGAAAGAPPAADGATPGGIETASAADEVAPAGRRRVWRATGRRRAVT